MSVTPIKTDNDLASNVRAKVVPILQTAQASALDLMGQCKQAHWNVKGPNFIALHEFFDKLHDTVEVMMDDLAERVVALGGMAEGRLDQAAKASTLPAYTAKTSEEDHLKALVQAFSSFAQQTRAAIDQTGEFGDQATADLFTSITRELDKQLWMIESHLKH
ncbi:MAG: DNA starvation/stationary phase protection protein Dps [Bdellovibrionales bacterium]